MPLRPRIDIEPHERHRLLPTAGTASREHFALLHRAMWADDRGLISDLALAMLPTVMGRPDRYGHQNDPYGMEVEPLLSVLVGSALGDMETYADARAEFARLSDAIDMTVLATRRTAADLSAPCRHRLDKGLQTVSTQLRSLTEIANRERFYGKAPHCPIDDHLIRLTRFDVVPTTVRFRGHNWTGVTGAADIDISALPEDHRAALDAITAIVPFSGIGAYTTSGFGATDRVGPEW